MATNLATQLAVSLNTQLSNVLDLGTVQLPQSLAQQYNWANGVAINTADRVFADTRTLTASSSEDLDLAGVLADGMGNTLTFARVKALLIRAAAANSNNVIVGNAASNGFISWVGGAVHTVTVRPGGLMLLAAPDATAYAVTAATADLLHVANSGAGTSVTYDVIIIGASA
jgi:hypothetical protein